MESTLRELLDKIYELEGLVDLTLKRENTDDFLRLIAKKGKEIGEITASLKLSANQEEIHPLKKPVLFDDYTIEETSEKHPLISEMEETENNQPLKYDSSEPQRGKLVFSINERFRYKKELFDNSDPDFNNTLALVASMENYEEAEDYFLNEEGFDYNNPIVKEFMEIIKRYFK